MAFPKGHKLSPGRAKGSKNKSTIAKEQARAEFEQAQLKRWLNITDNMAKRAVKDQKAAEYAVNQVIGKPKEIVEVQGLDFTFDDKERENNLVV